jgi:serine/threonine-protein kinase
MVHVVEAVQLLGGRYRLVEHLGGGGMSVVWRAYDEVLGRQVAVKVLVSQDGADAAARERIRTEAQAAARLTHPHIAGVHDYGESETASGEAVPYVVMELVHGPTLAQRLNAGPLPVRAALLVGAQVAAALAAAHARGLVHRDVKPGNVVLSPGGAKVVDFGIAAVAGEPGGPSDGKLWGTPAYLAPERLTGGEVVPESDVYALGLLIYRLLAGSLPWKAETVSQMLEAHQYTEPAPLSDLPGVPADVADLCRRCLAKQPDERPSAGEVARLLAGISGWHVAAEGDSGDIVIGALAGPPAGTSDDDADTRVVPLAVPVIPPRDRDVAPSAAAVPATSGRRRRARAVVAAIVLLAVGLLAGFCTAGDRVPGRGPGPAPSVAGPSVSGSATASGDASAPPGQPNPSGGSGPGAGSTAGGGPATGAGGARGTGTGAATGPPNAGPTPVDRTVVTPGGSATCRCVGPTATLTSFDPLPGFTATQIDRGPGTTVGVVFHTVARDVRVSFRCNNGVPEATIS